MRIEFGHVQMFPRVLLHDTGSGKGERPAQANGENPPVLFEAPARSPADSLQGGSPPNLGVVDRRQAAR